MMPTMIGMLQPSAAPIPGGISQVKIKDEPGEMGDEVGYKDAPTSKRNKSLTSWTQRLCEPST